ncbi:MAG: biotin transporter BioY [Sphaerochaetaceae bacterium]
MDLRKTIIIALFAALIVASSYIAFPIGPVPITLQSMFVLLAGLLGGQAIGLASVAAYLVLGAIGLPVFSGGVGGFAHFVTPTGGFLISWLVTAPVVGFIVDASFKGQKSEEKTTKKQLLAIITASVVGTCIPFLVGIPYLKLILDITMKQAIAVGFIPFIAGDLLKLVAAVLISNIFVPKFRHFLGGGAVDE